MTYMKLEDVHSATKEQILKATGFYRDSAESECNIDLGIHKHDDETVLHILESLNKYYYIINIVPSSLICEHAVKKHVIKTGDLRLCELGWPNLYEAIKNHFDTKSFLYDTVDCFVKTGYIDTSDSDENNDYRPFLLEVMPEYEEYFDHILKVFEAPENQECLFTDIEDGTYESKKYDIDEVWSIIEKRDLERKLDKSVPQWDHETKRNL